MRIYQVVNQVDYEGCRVIAVYSSLELANDAVREIYTHADDYSIGYNGEASELFTDEKGGLCFSRNDSSLVIRSLELDVDMSKFTTEEQRWAAANEDDE
jgi:hypothetical protein